MQTFAMRTMVGGCDDRLQTLILKKWPRSSLHQRARIFSKDCNRSSNCGIVLDQKIMIDPSASRAGNGKPSRSNVARIAASTASPPIAVPPLFSIV